MTPEQILQINEQMAKICRKDYRIHNRIVWVYFGEDGDIITESWKPHYDWNHLIEVYNACEIVYRNILMKRSDWTQGLPNEMTPLSALATVFINHNPDSILDINESYKRLFCFIDWYNQLPAPGTQSPDRTIPDTRR